MATRVKTIKYSVPTLVTTVADVTLTALSQITIYIPEASPVFRSVTVDMAFQDQITATGGTIGEYRAQVSLNTGTTTHTFTELNDIINTAENIGGILGPIDVTSYFTTTWSGTSMPFDMSVYFSQTTGTTLGMINVNATVTITYQYDDNPATNPTQIKTVYIPLESNAGALGTVANTALGSNQIPILTGASGILPENSVTIRDFSIIMEGNVSTAASATAITVSMNIDSGTAFAFGTMSQTLASDRYCRLIWKPAVPTTTTVHQMQLWANAARFNLATVMIQVTYEFNAAASTRIVNSLILPMEISSPLGFPASTEASRGVTTVDIQEPGTITLAQSAFRMCWNTTAAISGMNFRAGTQAYRALTHTGSGVSGAFCYQQRVDAGSAQGAGVTLVRGKNTFTVDGYATDVTDQASNLSGFFILNYITDKSPVGVGQHNHTVLQLLVPWGGVAVTTYRINNQIFQIPETTYWLTSVGFHLSQWTNDGTSGMNMDIECLPGENKLGGYSNFYADVSRALSEQANSYTWMYNPTSFKRYPGDPDDNRLAIETSRDYRFFSSAAVFIGMMMVVTYHSFSYTSSIKVFNSSGGNVTVKVYRTTDNRMIAESSRVGDGTVDIVGYDNEIDVYAIAYEDDAHLGRSANFRFGAA